MEPLGVKAHAALLHVVARKLLDECVEIEGIAAAGRIFGLFVAGTLPELVVDRPADPVGQGPEKREQNLLRQRIATLPMPFAGDLFE